MLHNMNNRIAVTGGTGYIGSRFVQHLISLKKDVLALVRHTSDPTSIVTMGLSPIVVDYTNSNDLADKLRAAIPGDPKSPV